MIAIGIFAIITWGAWVFIVLILIGLGGMVHGKIIKPYESEMQYIKEKKRRGYKFKLSPESIDDSYKRSNFLFAETAEKQESDEGRIYSEILEKEVRKCCYQSARLHDKYCICGRALEYPILKD